MKRGLKKLVVMLCISQLLTFAGAFAGEPCAHILICCRGNNEGIKFLVNGKWNPAHDYRDITQVEGVLQNIKEAGINTVIVDMTNASQWTNYWEEFEPMVNNIQAVCKKKQMQFCLFIGATLFPDFMEKRHIKDPFVFWNKMAEKIWNTWAKDPTYKRYGYGDNRPMLVAFLPSEDYWSRFSKAPASATNYLSKFRIGTCQVNDPILPEASDGWGYRNYSQSVDGKVRFAAPNGGVPPQDWKRIDKKEWKKRVEWAKQAGEYSIYGSYDDTCDAIHWGIADTKGTSTAYKKYPGDDPYYYYNVVKEVLTVK